MAKTGKGNDKKKKTYIDYKKKKTSLVVGKKPDGSPDRKYFYGKTKTEANDKKSEYKHQQALGIKLGDMTVAQWGSKWVNVYKADASESQKKHYKAKLAIDILPSIGAMKIKDVLASDLIDLMNNYSGGKSGTVKKVYQAIKQLFADAAYEGIIERDPAARLKLPTVEEDSRRPLTEAERKAVLLVAETHKRGAYVLTMLYCGVRRGECVALLRSDVDLDKKRLSINKAITHKYGNAGVLTGTKAANLRKKVKKGVDDCIREVPIPDLLLPVLKKVCSGKKDDDILFPKEDGKSATDTACRRWWSSIKRQLHLAAGAKTYRNAILTETSPFGDEVTPHFLRHTYGTDLHAAGVDEFTRKILMGHSLVDVTAGYTAMSDEAFNRAATQINDYLNGEKWKSKQEHEVA